MQKVPGNTYLNCTSNQKSVLYEAMVDGATRSGRAYTYPNQYKNIWLSPLFWFDTDEERLVTLVHEATHWDRVADNFRTHYPDPGKQSALKLARSWWKKSYPSRNPDSYAAADAPSSY